MPLFNWMEKEGLPVLPRGVSTLRTTPELPTCPFHFDRPSWIWTSKRFYIKMKNKKKEAGTWMEGKWELVLSRPNTPKKIKARGGRVQEWLTANDANTEGCVASAQPQMIFTSSFREWVMSACKPGLLPPNVGYTLIDNRYSEKRKWLDGDR